ncbi:FAD-linked oxidoreductase-like protein [Talaromyces proteolyticus]|uniref:Proline dehydrogenase n=1 Tax=Talaromyces proteolyticus TaxID=1131652 RepID=A0AAD4KY70_9EURO|nr:FAD-linked oxidoreductase-like protein [Talaromyces proteolyticus]KAH8700211.1 FAD-linked oxidoreductase-like protein [Talaromyces proteolyticus]
MALATARRPVFKVKPATFTPRYGVSFFNNDYSFQRVRPNSTSVLTKTTRSPEAKPTISPLSALPTTVLLRSLLVATISSKPYLLLPSLSILSFLCKPRRSLLLNVDRNPILHGFLKSTFYKQFCAGETHDEVKTTIRQFKNMGFQGAIMTYAKEVVFDHRTKAQHGLGIMQNQDQDVAGSVFCAHIEAWRKGTVETVELLGKDDYLAVKLTGAGPNVTEAFTAGELPPPQMLDALDEICTKCKDRGVRIIVDAESHHFLSGILRVTLELMRKYNRDGYASVYNTYQAYLKSTPVTLGRHLAASSEEGFTLGLKLVRGAYIATDDRSLIHDTKQDTDDAYNSIAQGALRQEIGEFGRKNGRPFPSVNLFLASHNKASVLAAHQLHQQRMEVKLPTVPVGYAQLHGMSDEVSFSLLQLKGSGGDPKVYKCSTWGGLGECLAYLLRRAIENRDAVSRTGDEYRALKAEVGRRLRSLISFST